MEDKDLDIYDGEEIEVSSIQGQGNQQGQRQGDGQGQGNGGDEGQGEQKGEGEQQGEGEQEGGEKQGQGEQQGEGEGDGEGEGEGEEGGEEQQQDNQGEDGEPEYPICVILRNGEYKGVFGEVIDEVGTIRMISPFGFFNLDREEYALVDDVVDYTYWLKIGVAYGRLYKVPTKQEVLMGIEEVVIINNEEGTYHTVNSKSIICLHKDGEVPETDPEELYPCKACNFIWELRKDSWKFESTVVEFDTHYALYSLYNLCQLDDNDVWHYKKESIETYGSQLLELDEKLLKAYILVLKNNPIYFKKDGYKYFFFDKIGNFIKSLIAENKIAFVGESTTVAPISDKEVILFNGVKIVIEEDYVELVGNENIDFAIMICKTISNAVNKNKFGEQITYGDINTERVQDLILKPMRGFVNLLK